MTDDLNTLLKSFQHSNTYQRRQATSSSVIDDAIGKTRRQLPNSQRLRNLSWRMANKVVKPLPRSNTQVVTFKELDPEGFDYMRHLKKLAGRGSDDDLNDDGSRKEEKIRCSRCSTEKTPLWRWEETRVLCNACGLFSKLSPSDPDDTTVIDTRVKTRESNSQFDDDTLFDDIKKEPVAVFSLFNTYMKNPDPQEMDEEEFETGFTEPQRRHSFEVQSLFPTRTSHESVSTVSESGMSEPLILEALDFDGLDMNYLKHQESQEDEHREEHDDYAWLKAGL